MTLAVGNIYRLRLPQGTTGWQDRFYGNVLLKYLRSSTFRCAVHIFEVIHTYGPCGSQLQYSAAVYLQEPWIEKLKEDDMFWSVSDRAYEIASGKWPGPHPMNLFVEDI